MDVLRRSVQNWGLNTITFEVFFRKSTKSLRRLVVGKRNISGLKIHRNIGTSYDIGIYWKA
jgi:hypothetical protein